MSKAKLGQFLREIANWSWEEFVNAERDGRFTTNEAIIFSLIRACALEKLPAIKLALDRLDGKLKTPIQIEYPKIYYIFPYAKTLEFGNANDDLEPEVRTSGDAEVRLAIREPDAEPEPEVEQTDLPSLGLRETLAKMSDYPRELPESVIQLAVATEMYIHKKGPPPPEVPRVKSVIAAHLLTMARNRNIEALTEVFDQIDGKLTETLQVLGEDIYITDHSTVAPAGAVRNEDGIYQIEATEVQTFWANKLKEHR